MTRIDEIISAGIELGEQVAAGYTGVEQERAMRDLIAASIAEAKREGAIEAQQRMFPCCGGNDESPAEHTMDCEHTARRLAELDAARREGAEQMREAIAHQAEINALYGVHGTTVSTIRAMPLPDDSRAHGERHGTATPGQRAAQLEAIDEFGAAKRGEQ
jgi:hypothetical protein